VGQRQALVGIAITMAGLAACGASLRGQLDMGVIEEGLATRAGNEFPGATVGTVTCPESREHREGDQFTCTVVIDGQDVEYEIVQVDDHGEVDPERAADVVPVEVREFEAVVARFVRQNESVDVAATCGEDRRWIFLTGPARIDCRVDYGDLIRGVEIDVDAAGIANGVAFTQARLDLPTVNDRVVQQLIGPLGGAFLLACPETFSVEGAVVALDPGAAFDCAAYRELVEIATIRVTVRDVQGLLSAEVKGSP